MLEDPKASVTLWPSLQGAEAHSWLGHGGDGVGGDGIAMVGTTALTVWLR